MSFMKIPKISIITPSFNQGQFIEETILSVINQDYPNLEYIIIDGGSTDKSIEIIKKYEKYLTYWVSEKDRGQTHAINKGLKRTAGEIVNWLNADDLLASRSLHIVAEEFVKTPGADIYYGDFTFIDERGEVLFSRKSPPYSFSALLYGRQLSSQPAVFFKRHVLKQVGYLDESIAFCMDTEFWIRTAMRGSKFHHLKRPLGRARLHKEAKSCRLQKVLHDEHKAIVLRHRAWRLPKGSLLEDAYYTFLNRLWRFVAALNRFIYRGDWTFGKASKALRRVQYSKRLQS